MKLASFTLTDAGSTTTRPLVRRRLTVLALVGLAGMAPLSAATLAFQRVTDNSPTDLSSDLSVEVTDLGGGLARFNINRGTEYEAFLRNVYFEDVGDTLGTITFSSDLSTPGIHMDGPSRPANPPGLSPFVVDSSFDAEAPGPKNGIDTGESGAFIAAYIGTYQELLDALVDGTVRVAVHAQGIEGPEDGGDGSDSDPRDKIGDYGGGDHYGSGGDDDHSPDEGGLRDGEKSGESDTYVSLQATPEPSSLVLLCLASLGLLRRVRR